MSLALRHTRIPLALALREAAVLTWHELPKVIALSAVVAVTWLPLALVMLAGSLTAAPAAIAVAAAGYSALSVGAAAVVHRRRLRIRDLTRIDLVWVAATTLVGSTTMWAAASREPAALVFASFVAAVASAVLPLAAAYGGVRGLRGVAALRGGVIIAVIRPSVSVCVLALGVLTGFAVVASAGVLMLALPALHAVYAQLLASEVVALVNGDDV